MLKLISRIQCEISMHFIWWHETYPMWHLWHTFTQFWMRCTVQIVYIHCVCFPPFNTELTKRRTLPFFSIANGIFKYMGLLLSFFFFFFCNGAHSMFAKFNVLPQCLINVLCSIKLVFRALHFLSEKSAIFDNDSNICQSCRNRQIIKFRINDIVGYLFSVIQTLDDWTISANYQTQAEINFVFALCTFVKIGKVSQKEKS